MKKLKRLKIGNVGLIQETKDGRIIQIALTEKQSNMLQVFLAALSKDQPLVQMTEEFDLILKRSVPDTSKWVACEDKLPGNLQTVWLANVKKQWVCLGCLVENDDQFEGEYNYHWAEGNGVIYSEDNKIVTECKSDDLDVTHWCPVPDLPENI